MIHFFVTQRFKMKTILYNSFEKILAQVKDCRKGKKKEQPATVQAGETFWLKFILFRFCCMEQNFSARQLQDLVRAVHVFNAQYIHLSFSQFYVLLRQFL